MKKQLQAMLTIVAVGLLTASAVFADDGDPRLGSWLGHRIAGTWMAQIAVPPTPWVGNTEVVIVPEMVTFMKYGGVITTPSLPLLPFPTPEGVVPAQVSTGHANWERVGVGRIQTTNWRFLTHPISGELVGFVKIYVEFRLASAGEMTGSGILEVLYPDLTPVEFMGEPMALVAEILMSRVPVETLPAP